MPQTTDTLLEAITVLATKSANAPHHEPADNYASAAKNLAEAYAWLMDRSQPH